MSAETLTCTSCWLTDWRYRFCVCAIGVTQAHHDCPSCRLLRALGDPSLERDRALQEASEVLP